MTGLRFIAGDDATSSDIVSDRELYADDALSRLVEAGEAGAGVILAHAAGAVIEGSLVSALGLELVDGKVQQRGATPKVPVKEREAGADKQLKPAGKTKKAAKQ